MKNFVSSFLSGIWNFIVKASLNINVCFPEFFEEKWKKGIEMFVFCWVQKRIARQNIERMQRGSIFYFTGHCVLVEEYDVTNRSEYYRIGSRPRFQSSCRQRTSHKHFYWRAWKYFYDTISFCNAVSNDQLQLPWMKWLKSKKERCIPRTPTRNDTTS